jgi:ketosteroid isomerase-like protein
MPDTDVVRASFEAYLAQDRAAAERLLAEDNVFTSPQDDHIGKAAFLRRCFPAATETRVFYGLLPFRSEGSGPASRLAARPRLRRVP